MVPLSPSPFYAVVFRGGDTRFLPAAIAMIVMAHKSSGQETIVLEYPEPNVVDLKAVERIEPFPIWQSAVEERLQADGRFICPYGTIHGRDGMCRCMRSGKLPLTWDEAKLCIVRRERYHALSPERKREYDLQSDGAMARLCDHGYFDLLAAQHGLTLQASRQ